MNENPLKYEIPNLSKACEVLRRLVDYPDGVSFRELYKVTKIPRTSLLRICETLIHQGFIEEDGDRLLRLGPEMMRIGAVFLSRFDVRQQSLPYLTELAHRTRGTAHLAILAGHHSLILAVEESPERIRAVSRAGFLADLHCSSTGKCFLAFSVPDPASVIRMLDLAPRTLSSVTDPDVLIASLAEIRRLGYAIDDEEYAEGVRCCAAPVYDLNRRVVAAIGITSPKALYPPDATDRVAPVVKDVADRLSRDLGYSV
jgi:DNA-binding IclR family transcriptional regulator